MEDAAAPHALPEPKLGRDSAQGQGATSRFMSISTISPLLQVKQICPQNQLREVQPRPAGTDGLAEQDESFGKFKMTWMQPQNGLLLNDSSTAGASGEKSKRSL